MNHRLKRLCWRTGRDLGSPYHPYCVSVRTYCISLQIIENLQFIPFRFAEEVVQS